MRFSKQLCFEATGDTRTRVHLHFSYSPPGGVIGHSIARVLGCDAKNVLTELLIRAKYFLETGREPHDAMCHKRRAAGNWKQALGASDSGPPAPRGPGAPTEDVVRAGRAGAGELRPPSPWPEATSAGPKPTETSGQFPPGISR